MPVFKDALLEGQAIALAGAESMASALEGLGAEVQLLDPGFDEAAALEWAQRRAPLHTLLSDLRPAFGAGELGAALESLWAPVRAVAVGAMIPGGAGGKIALIAPAPDAGAHAQAVRAAAENLARTLSVEWARYGIKLTAITPGEATTEAELVALACFLASPAGEYLTGCRLDLGLIRTS